MRIHLDVYALANLIQHSELEKKAMIHFQVAIHIHWCNPTFMDGIKLVYNISPPGVQGDALRNGVVKVAAQHAHEFYRRDNNFSKLTLELPAFADDLARALAGAYNNSYGPPIKSSLPMWGWTCPKCSATYYDETSKCQGRRCPRCYLVSNMLEENLLELEQYVCEHVGCNYVMLSADSEVAKTDNRCCPACGMASALWKRV